MKGATAFLCRCGAEVTDFLAPASIAPTLLSVGRWVVPQGEFLRLDGAMTYGAFLSRGLPIRYASPDADGVAFEAGDWLIHEKSAIFQMAPRAIHGCCGWQPREEANVVCAARHPIGTLHTDECWSPLVLRLHHARVEAVTLD